MRISKTALNALIVSIVACLLALALTLFGKGLRFQFGAEATISYLPLWLAMLAAVIVSFFFGWVRYDLAGGIALCAAVLHDQLLSLALTAILSLAFGLSSYLPAFLVAGVAFTYLFTVPVLRDARTLLKGNTGMDRKAAAAQAVKSTRPLKFIVVAISALVLLAFLISGNMVMAGNLLPLITGLLAAAFSSCLITPYIWAAIVIRSKKRR